MVGSKGGGRSWEEAFSLGSSLGKRVVTPRVSDHRSASTDKVEPPTASGATEEGRALAEAERRAFEAQLDLARRREAVDGERIRDLEAQVRALTLEAEASGRMKAEQIERDLEAFKAGKHATEIDALDLRAQLKMMEGELERMRLSPALRLGEELLATGSGWRKILGFPGKIQSAREETAKLAEMSADELLPDLLTAESVHYAELALQRADVDGFAAAGRWLHDQRRNATVTSRGLMELARHACNVDPELAVALAKEAVAAEPNEWRIKHFALLLNDMGHVAGAIDVMRAAIAAGVMLNPTETRRYEELCALERLGTEGAGLPSRAEPRGNPRSVLIYAPRSFPNHWSTASFRALALALALRKDGYEATIVTPPGYPRGKNGEVLRDRDIVAGVTHRRLPAASTAEHHLDVHAREIGKMLAALASQLGAGVIVAPSPIASALPAMTAARLGGLASVIDCTEATQPSGATATEREAVLAGLEDQLLATADAVIVRDDVFVDRLTAAGVTAEAILDIGEGVPDFGTDASAPNWREDSAIAGRVVLGWVGEANADIDLEVLPAVVRGVVDRGHDVALAIFGVGTRFQRVRESAELLGLADRILFPGRPRPGHIARVFETIDIILAPATATTTGERRSRFELVEAAAHGRAIVASGMIPAGLRDSLCSVEDVGSSAVEALVEAVAGLVVDPDRRETLGRRASAAVAGDIDAFAARLTRLGEHLTRAE